MKIDAIITVDEYADVHVETLNDDFNKIYLFDLLEHQLFEILDYRKGYDIDDFLSGYDRVMDVMEFVGTLVNTGSFEALSIIRKPLRSTLIEDDSGHIALVFPKEISFFEEAVLYACVIEHYLSLDKQACLFGGVIKRILAIINAADQKAFLKRK